MTNFCTYTFKVEKLEKPVGYNFSLDEAEQALIKHQPMLFFVTQGESSTVVHQSLEGLGALCHKVNMLGPGPTNCHPRVMHAMSLPVISPMHEECFQVMDDIKAGLQYVMQTKNPLTMALSSSGNGAMEACMCNLVEPDEVVLIGINGMWSMRAADIAERHRAKVIRLEKEAGLVYNLQEVEDALKKHRPILFFIVLGESSTGVLQPMEGLGKLCHRYNCLLVVDAVVALGAVPVYTDQWEVDVIISGSQKALSCPPGLAPISVSARALEKIKSRKTPVSVRYFDVITLGEYWGCFGKKPRQYHHTCSLNLYYALREGLAIIAEEGLEQLWERHKFYHKKLIEGLDKLGIDLFVKDESIRLACVTPICVPNADWNVINNYLLKKHHTEITVGVGPTAGRVLRVGLMGYSAREHTVEHILRILKDALDYAKDIEK